jgi:CIC family chloride channel protein
VALSIATKVGKMKDRGDFTVEVRLLWISVLALLIGMACAVVARVLLGLIDFFTNLFYFQNFSLAHNTPAKAVWDHLGLISIVIPVIGSLIIGLMAKYGSERIRGHGIPEALEAILYGGSRMSPKVAILKPLSSAISIGSGGPFGAEGPIIMTGGACGSIIGQLFNLTGAERKTLLVAGAAAGMAATFGTPVAAVLLAVELLLFEWKPRSLIPVALACSAAVIVRPLVFSDGAGPLFKILEPHKNPLSRDMLLFAGVVGLGAGLFALLLTLAVYAMEDLFHRLPIHWAWWPAIGGLVVGIGGCIQPRALGVGYDIIESLLNGGVGLDVLIPLVLVKAVIWSVALGSGTSGGVLAPLLMMGGAVGAILSYLLPGGDAALWALVGMGAIMGGTMRSPFTGIIFALELTQDVNALPPLLLASIIAYAFTVLIMKRSILTEKVARRGYHVSREYSVDPLETTMVGEVMASEVVTAPANLPAGELLSSYFLNPSRKHQAYPVVDANGNLLGVVTKTDLLTEWVTTAGQGDELPRNLILAYDLIRREPVTVFAWESCRHAAERMAQFGVGRLPVVSADDPRKVIGMVSRSDLLKPRARRLEDELKRERFLLQRREMEERKQGEQ